MPTYAYRCTACNHRFDAIQRMADGPLTECPNCGGLPKRTIQNVPVVFKGSGWYITDSRKSNGASSESAAKTETIGAKSTETAKPSETAKSAKSEPVAAAAD